MTGVNFAICFCGRIFSAVGELADLLPLINSSLLADRALDPTATHTLDDEKAKRLSPTSGGLLVCAVHSSNRSPADELGDLQPNHAG